MSFAHKAIEIRSAILEGDIDRALKHTKAFYPYVLRDNPRIYFHLRCRKFVEMMRLSTSQTPMPRTKALNGQGPHSTTTDDVFEQEMELDDPNGEGDDWDRMETEEANDRGATGLQDRMKQTLEYAQELRREYRDDKSKEVADRLQEIFALFAYEDPKNSPTADVMDPSGRAPVAEELNSAILGELLTTLTLSSVFRSRFLQKLFADTSRSFSRKVVLCCPRAPLSTDRGPRVRNK